ncbi:hypothetical protein [Paraburkholderia sp. Ac-20347]|uniref:hypothetical protein n=1 Tax=Paraburkholderia sp. Ac-20347 TaxID=2703892 RepID=UPI00197F3CF6|nr:hypothetical protein [Paraburkholderia sp. Ac-20347]MBN3814570.1 hypothetical protein [Paraburkholderia sp. Ac-20347]
MTLRFDKSHKARDLHGCDQYADDHEHPAFERAFFCTRFCTHAGEETKSGAIILRPNPDCVPS